MTRRPYLHVRRYTWREPPQPEEDGVALLNQYGVQAHLTWMEARTLADRLHDLADANGMPEEPLPSSAPDLE